MKKLLPQPIGPEKVIFKGKLIEIVEQKIKAGDYEYTLEMAKVKKIPEKELKKGVDYIGVTCVFFCHDGKGNLLMHKRSQNCRDERGHWDVGGGSLEFGESFEEGVTREIKEEYCCDVLDLKFVDVKNVLRVNHNNKKTHWIALLFAAHIDPSQVKIGEPEAIEELGWFTEKNWPEPIHSYFHSCYEIVKTHLIP